MMDVLIHAQLNGVFNVKMGLLKDQMFVLNLSDHMCFLLT